MLRTEDEIINRFIVAAMERQDAHLHIDEVYKVDKRGKDWISKGIRLYESAIHLKKEFACDYKVGLVIPLADTKRNTPLKVNHLNALRSHLWTTPEIGLYRMDEEDTLAHFRKTIRVRFPKQHVYNTFRLYSRYYEDDKCFSHWLYFIEDFK
jgi:hypothetical protein